MAQATKILRMIQVANNSPAVQEGQETWVPSLGREDPLEEDVATHSSILAWRIPGTEDRGGLQSMGSQRVRPDWAGTDAHALSSRVKTPWKSHVPHGIIVRWRRAAPLASDCALTEKQTVVMLGPWDVVVTTASPTAFFFFLIQTSLFTCVQM